jgi:hypothetical protein
LKPHLVALLVVADPRFGVIASTQKQFRRLKGFHDTKRLLAALDRLNTNSGMETEEATA